MTVQYNFSGPLYEQVLGRLRTRIESGEWSAGYPLPGETHLSRDFGVSVGTMRKAMDRLVQERIVTRERGRGTFVKEISSWRIEQGMQICDGEGHPISPHIAFVKSSAGIATAAETKALRLRTNLFAAPRVLRLSREWRYGGKLICLEKITVRQSSFPNLADFAAQANETLHDVYAEQYKTLIDRTLWSIKPMPSVDQAADEPEALQSSLLMRCVRIAFDAKNTPIELCEQLHTCDGHSFQLGA